MFGAAVLKLALLRVERDDSFSVSDRQIANKIKISRVGNFPVLHLHSYFRNFYLNFLLSMRNRKTMN
jgi:hypothetical protein